MKVNNAIILAAGTSSRFAPLSYEIHKALITVRGEVLIERQIRQLREAGIEDVIIVTGYKSEQFEYLKDKYGVRLVHNPDYKIRNNNSSIWAVKDYLKNSYICSSDNYFQMNPFEDEVDESYYSAVYVEGDTNEWCIKEDNGIITDVTIGGSNSLIMLGHVFWSNEFSSKFISILEGEYDRPETADKLWETIYIDHIKELVLTARQYPGDFIYEFDTLDELRGFDTSYIADSRSLILKSIAKELRISESDITNIKTFKDKDNTSAGFYFDAGKRYKYFYETGNYEEV